MISSSSGCIFTEAAFDSGGGLLRSADDGLTWKKIPILSNYYAIYGITERAPREILAASYFGDIFRSTDNGDSWSTVVSRSAEKELVCIASDKAGNCYAAGDSSVLVSNDGTTWKEVPVRESYAFGESFAIDSQGNIFLGTSSYGVNHSTDQGKTWNLMNDGLDDTYVECTVADDSNNVFLGTAYGIYRLADSVDEWGYFGTGYPSTFITALSTSPSGFLFAGTQSYGIYKSAVSVDKRIIPTGHPTPIAEITDFNILQNYPNPFNSQTMIQYDVPGFAKVEIKIYNILGQSVATLVSGIVPKGSYSLKWDPRQLASGLYFCKMTAWNAFDSYQKTIKLLYLR
jgi:ligand-binding sensor domain-containing protein